MKFSPRVCGIRIAAISYQGNKRRAFADWFGIDRAVGNKFIHGDTQSICYVGKYSNRHATAINNAIHHLKRFTYSVCQFLLLNPLIFKDFANPKIEFGSFHNTIVLFHTAKIDIIIQNDYKYNS